MHQPGTRVRTAATLEVRVSARSAVARGRQLSGFVQDCSVAVARSRSRGLQGLCWCSLDGDGAGEPSDQRLTGMNNTLGSNELPSAPRMGEAFSPAPQAAASPCGTKNITWGSQGPAESSLR